MPKPSKQKTAAADKLLLAILAQVAFDGWSRAALLNGAKAAGLTQGHLDLAYPHGVRDVVAAFMTMIDDAMLARIAGEKLYSRMRTREKIAYAVRTRLELMTPHREAMRHLCLWYALPHHAPEAIRNTARLTDAIWRAAGDTSTDFNFYTKRALLAFVMKTTTLFWLSDASEDSAATWQFLDRRIAEVLQAGQAASKLRDLPRHLNKLTILSEALNRFRRA